MCAEQQRGNLQETLENLRQPMPLDQKLYLILRNYWIKIRTRSTCCGSHGQPGC
jgi:hypothetical protein